MSGTVPLQSQQYPIYPILIDRLPRGAEGSKALFVPINWLSVLQQITIVPTPTRLIASLNLLAQFNTGQFTTIQAIYVDNSTCPYPVVITSIETGQQINVNPFTRGMYPIFASVAPAFTIELEFFQTPNYNNAYGNDPLVSGQTFGTTRVTFLNTPQRYFESAYTGTPQNYTGNFNTAVTTPITLIDNLSTGFGMQSIDSQTLKRINQLYLSMVPSVAFAAITNIAVTFSEQSPSFGQITHWIYRFNQPASQQGVVAAIGFPGGLLQVDPASSFQFAISNLPPAGSWILVWNIQYNQLTFN